MSAAPSGRSRRAARRALRPSVPDSRRRRDVVQRSRDLRADRIRAASATSATEGSGSFIVFGNDAGGIWVKRIVALAVERNLWLHAHCDDAALEILFGHDPRARIIWAHSGFTTPRPSSPGTWSAIRISSASCRSGTTSPTDGRIAPAWHALFLAYPGPIRRRFGHLGQRPLGSIRRDHRVTTGAGFASCRLMSRRRSLPGNGERLFAGALDR